MKKIVIALILLVSALFLAACNPAETPEGDPPGNPSNPGNPDNPGDPGSPGNPGGPPSGQSAYTKIGFIGVAQSAFGGEQIVSASASFVGYNEVLPDSFAENPFVAGGERCFVSRSSDTPPENPLPEPGDDFSASSLDAGDQISIDEDDANYLRLPRQLAADTISYFASRSDPLPAALSVTLPGADFPAFAGLALPTLQVLELSEPVLPLTVPITTESTFAWTAAAGNTYLLLTAFQIDLDDSSLVGVSCFIEDDGAFAFPADTKAELGADFSVSTFIMSRSAFSRAEKDDAVLFLSVSSTVNGSILDVALE